ncbi:MAG: hypothetical protein OXL40_07110, partial [Bacteroidota bacterium]|nr:hypothetical protein [Bacteroidota bacterium]
AHIAICFAAFAMLRILRRIYNTRHGAEAPISEGQILAQLREVEVSVVRDNTSKRYFAIPSAANSTSVRLYKALGLTIQRRPYLWRKTRNPRFKWLVNVWNSDRKKRPDRQLCSVQIFWNTPKNRPKPLQMGPFWLSESCKLSKSGKSQFKMCHIRECRHGQSQSTLTRNYPSSQS